VRLSTCVQVDAVCRHGFHPDPGPVLLPERSEPRPCTTCERAIVEVATQVTCHRSLRTVRLAFLRHDLLASRSNDRVGHHVCHPAADAGEVAQPAMAASGEPGSRLVMSREVTRWCRSKSSRYVR
jgi:hypothetical protein